MDHAVENLGRLGLREYEAKIYVALVGLGEANVRSIHEVSGVPRPRVYDVLNSLAAKGFINIRQGSPLMYRAVRPDIVVSFLKKDLDSAAPESVKALEALSVDAQQNYSPIWYVHSDWTIQRNLESAGRRCRFRPDRPLFQQGDPRKIPGTDPVGREGPRGKSPVPERWCRRSRPA